MFMGQPGSGKIAMRLEVAFVALFSVATAVALLARWVKIPYTIALVVAGLILGTVHAFQPPHLTKELLFAVFLPGLVFEAAFHLDFHRFWQNKFTINALAVPGVIASLTLTTVLFFPAASALHFLDGLRIEHALVFAALIAATDPIAVVALFKSMHAPKRLTMLIESESLLNDGTAVVFFTIALSHANGESVSIGGAALDFCKIVGMGALIGTCIGLGVSRLLQRVADPMIEITLTTLAAYGSFVTAEQFHFSGIIATVAAGMVCGNYAGRAGMSPSSQIAVETFWEYVSFALNSIVFLLIGFEVRIESLLQSWSVILMAYLAVTISRAGVVYLVTLLLRRSSERLPWSWSMILTWGGLRGGLSMVLVLGLAPDFPFRAQLITITFGVVLLSILIQGLTTAPLMRWLAITGTQADRSHYESARLRVRTKNAALDELDQMLKAGLVHADAVQPLREEYATALAAAEQAVRELHLQTAELQQEELHAAQRQLLLIEKGVALESLRKGIISQAALEHLLADIDARLFKLDNSRD